MSELATSVFQERRYHSGESYVDEQSLADELKTLTNNLPDNIAPLVEELSYLNYNIMHEALPNL